MTDVIHRIEPTYRAGGGGVQGDTSLANSYMVNADVPREPWHMTSAEINALIEELRTADWAADLRDE